MDENDKGEEMSLMEQVSNNGKNWVTEKGVGGVKIFGKKNDMGESDEGEEMSLMEQVSKNFIFLFLFLQLWGYALV